VASGTNSVEGWVGSVGHGKELGRNKVSDVKIVRESPLLAVIYSGFTMLTDAERKGIASNGAPWGQLPCCVSSFDSSMTSSLGLLLVLSNEMNRSVPRDMGRVLRDTWLAQ